MFVIRCDFHFARMMFLHILGIVFVCLFVNVVCLHNLAVTETMKNISQLPPHFHFFLFWFFHFISKFFTFQLVSESNNCVYLLNEINTADPSNSLNILPQLTVETIKTKVVEIFFTFPQRSLFIHSLNFSTTLAIAAHKFQLYSFVIFDH
jgi:hypothetical protein